MVLIEQRAEAALRISDRGYVLVGGRLAIEGPASELLQRNDMGKVFLGAEDS